VDFLRLRPVDFGTLRWQAPRFVAWVMPKRGPIRCVDLGPASAVEKAVADAGRAVAAGPADCREVGEAEAARRAREALAALGRLVVEPLRPELGPAARWVL